LPSTAARLRAERSVVTDRIDRLDADMASVVAASVDSNADDEHDPEGATIAYERAQLAALIEQARAHLAEIDAAEERVAQGTYGTCDVCHEPIDPARLEARPTAATCVRHADRGAQRR
jgi:RNA polymerase-binding transcription factor DksA